MSSQLVDNCPGRSARWATPPCLPFGLLELPSSSQMDEILASVLLGQMIWCHGVLSHCQRWLMQRMSPLPPSSRPGSQGDLLSLSPPTSFFPPIFSPLLLRRDWERLGGWQAASHGQPATADFERAQRCHGEAQNDSKKFLWGWNEAPRVVAIPCFWSSRSHPALGAVCRSERGHRAPTKQLQRVWVASRVPLGRDIYNRMPARDGWARPLLSGIFRMLQKMVQTWFGRK